MENENPFTAPVSTPDNGKTVGIISYLTIIGWLIAYFAYHKDNKTELGSYQLRQTLLLYIAAAIIAIILRIISGLLLFSGGFELVIILNYGVQIAMFIFWIIGFIGALNGTKKPIPLIGDRAQTMFISI
ncbi:Uncharacterized membrane protein [bacterium A37T11]|nr:Uncharacterized membrane protein [bacterium A37T11]